VEKGERERSALHEKTPSVGPDRSLARERWEEKNAENPHPNPSLEDIKGLMGREG